MKKYITFGEQSFGGRVVIPTAVRRDALKKAFVVNEDRQLTGGVEHVVETTQTIEIGKKGQQTDTFGTVVRRVVARNNTVTGGKVGHVETYRPAKGGT